MNAINPLPGLLQASALDAGNSAMRKAGRAAWSDDGYNESADTLHRLIYSCYGKPDDVDPNYAFIRFSIADTWERQGHINISSNWRKVLNEIDRVLARPANGALAP